MEMTVSRRRLSSLAFSLGGLLLVGAGFAYLMRGQFDVWAQVPAGLGLLALGGGVLLEPERVRRAIAGRQGRYGSNALVMSLAFTGVLVVVNLLAYNNPQRLDLTEDKDYSLSPETTLLLAELSQPVRIIGFYTPNREGSRESLRPLLDQYEMKSRGLVSVEFVDPEANPLVADQYGITTDASMAVVIGDSSQVIAYPSEREISSAIIRLANPQQRVVRFLAGHGERELEAADEVGLSRLKAGLEAKNYRVESLNLLVEGSVPADTTVLVIAGPQVAMGAEEAAQITDFLERGGSLVALLDPITRPDPSRGADALLQLLEEGWGLRPRPDFVVDRQSIHPFIGLSARYTQHPITERMQNLATLYPAARSIEILPEQTSAAGVSATELVLTGENSWGETDVDALLAEGRGQLDEQFEAAGPLALAVVAENPAWGSRLVLFGDSDFAANSDYFSSGNADMITNSIDWAARQEALINLTPKERTQRQVVPPSRESVVLLLLATVGLIPGSVVVMGVLVFWNRRKRI